MREAEQRRKHDRHLLARRLPAHVEALVAGRGHLREIDRDAAELDAGGKALQQPPENDEQRREHADCRVARHEGDQDRAAGHDRQRDDEAFAPPHPVDIGTENQRADRAHGEARGEAQERQHQRGVGVVVRKERVRDLPGVDAEQEEIVHLEEVAAGDAEHRLELVEARLAHSGLPRPPVSAPQRTGPAHASQRVTMLRASPRPAQPARLTTPSGPRPGPRRRRSQSRPAADSRRLAPPSRSSRRRQRRQGASST